MKKIYKYLSKISPVLATKLKFFFRKIEFKRVYSFSKQKVSADYIIDITAINRYNEKTGIQRVVENIVKNLDKKYTLSCFYDKEFYAVNNIFNKSDLNLIDTSNCKVLFLLDGYHDFFYDYIKKLDLIKKQGPEIIGIVHDLVHLKNKDMVGSDGFAYIFKKYIDMQIKYCNKIICVSRTTADDLCDYICKNNIIKSTKKLNVYYAHLASELIKKNNISYVQVRKNLKDYITLNNTFLMIGTVQIRKNYITVCKAFEYLWKQNIDIKLLIIGRYGWQNEDFIDFYNKYKKFGKILWLQDATDIELSYSYANSTALIFASFLEGFGLPLVEASQYNLPILCSDIPIFHEVAQENSMYFNPYDYISIAKCIETFRKQDKHIASININRYTWVDMANKIQDIIDDKIEEYKSI